MASKACLVLVIATVLAVIASAHAADPDITSDFVVPAGTTVDGSFFTFTGFRKSLSMDWPINDSFVSTKATQVEFPALTGQSLSLSVLQFAPRGLNPPHTHPRSAELLIVLQGTLEVGFVDSTNKLYNWFLFKGDAFVFPKGLVHFQVNVDSKHTAVAVSSFASSNPGIVSLPKTIFGSGIYTWLLAQSFKTDVEVINKIVANNSA